jgi:UDP-2,3-diacylglucosamine hydrolase
MRRLFLADVHLSPAWPERTARLVRLLAREVPRAAEVYILGDLFDYWIGPKHLGLPDYAEALDALRRASAAGVRVVYLHGNRDLLLCQRFAEAVGVEMAAGALDLVVAGQRVRLCHGDQLCTRDWSGRTAQAVLRWGPIAGICMRLPVRLATFLAEGYRRHSRLATARKPHRQIALAEEAVLAVFAEGVQTIVCGHLHKAARHVWRIGEAEKVLYALGDWAPGPSYIIEEDGRWQLYG